MNYFKYYPNFLAFRTNIRIILMLQYLGMTKTRAKLNKSLISRLAQSIDSNKIDARCEGGAPEVHIPNGDTVKSRRIQIGQSKKTIFTEVLTLKNNQRDSVAFFLDWLTNYFFAY